MGIRCGTLYWSTCSKNEARILILGLDAAGKTTALYKMKLGEIVTTIPTIGFNVETLAINDLTLTVWDVSGRSRPLWRHYYMNTQAIVFMVDSNDVERLSDVREEIFRMSIEDELNDSVFLILANKQDLSSALNCDQLTEKLGLMQLRNRIWKIMPTKAVDGTGLTEAFEWLVDELKKKQGISTAKTVTSLWYKTSNILRKITGL